MIANPHRLRRSPIAWLVILLAFTVCSPACAAQPNAAPTITFRKVFKSSFPEFVEITISENGSGTYDIRSLSDAPSPQPFQCGESLARRIFDLAGKLHNFQNANLDVHRRIANLGTKTFQYENGSEKNEVTFNYTLDESATRLTNIFEGLSREQMDLSDLERTMHYDHLGVNDVIRQIESDYGSKLLPEPTRLLPLLDRVASDDTFVNPARERARNLANKIRSSH